MLDLALVLLLALVLALVLLLNLALVLVPARTVGTCCIPRRTHHHSHRPLLQCGTSRKPERGEELKGEGGMERGEGWKGEGKMEGGGEGMDGWKEG